MITTRQPVNERRAWSLSAAILAVVASCICGSFGRSLGLSAPSLPQLKIVQQSSDVQIEEACSDLIQYPEDNAWIKSPSQQITITGDQDATWYLNGLKLRPQMNQAQITEPGINIITAVRGDCTETNKFFVDF